MEEINAVLHSKGKNGEYEKKKERKEGGKKREIR